MSRIEVSNEDLKPMVSTYEEETKDKSLYQKVEYAFNIFWYETGIPEIAPTFIRHALDYTYPREDDTNDDLRSKLFIICLIARDSPFLEGQAIAKYIDNILIPIANHEEDKQLEYLLATLSED